MSKSLQLHVMWLYAGLPGSPKLGVLEPKKVFWVEKQVSWVPFLVVVCGFVGIKSTPFWKTKSMANKMQTVFLHYKL